MRRHSRIISFLLVLTMLLPITIASSLPADAALQKNARVTFDESFDFENAFAGDTLTQDYINAQLYADFKASTLTPTSSAMSMGRWKIEQETDENGEENNFVALDDANYPYGSFAIEDESLMLWETPFELSFDVRYKTFRINSLTDSGGNRDATLISICRSGDFASRVRLVGVTRSVDATYVNLKNAYNASGALSSTNNGTTIGRLEMNQWHNVKVRVYTDSGRVITYLDGTLVDDSIADTFVEAGIHGGTTTVKGSGICIGYGWGDVTKSLVDMDIDNIELRTFVDETETFDKAVIANGKASYISTMLNDTSRFSVTTTDNTESSYYSVVKESNGNAYLRQYVHADDAYNGTPCGKSTNIMITHKKASGDSTLALQNEAFEISVDYKWDGSRTNAWWNPIRLSYGGSTFVPLRMNGASLCITGSGYLVLRKTGDDAYKVYTMPEGVWHKFRVVFNPNVGEGGTGDPTLELYMTIGDGEEEQLYFPTSQKTYDMNKHSSKTFTASEVTTAEKLLAHDTKLEMSKWTKCEIYFVHGFGNGFMNFTNGKTHDWHVDNISIKTINSDAVNEYIDFEGEAFSGDGMEDNSFAVIEPVISNMKLSDWEITNDPVSGGTRGKVIHTIPHSSLYRTNSGIYAGSIYTVVDTENALLGYEFEFSFDLNVKTAPTNWMNLLKVHTKTTQKADGSFSVSSSPNFTLLRMNSGSSNTYIVQAFNGSTQLNGTSSSGGLGFSKTLNKGEWVNFKMRLNPSTGEFSLYINGENVFENNVNTLYGAGKLDDMNCMLFEILNQWTATSATNLWGEYYLDNVSFKTLDILDQKPEFTSCVPLDVNFEDEGAWLESAKSGTERYLGFGYSNASIISIGTNKAVDLSGSKGSLISYSLDGMAGYHNTFTLEMSVSYNDIHGSAVSLASISDTNISGGSIELLRAYGENAKPERTRALYFMSESYNYYLYDKSGNMLHVADIGSGELTKIAFVVDAASDRYAIYVNESPAYIREDAAANGELKIARDIPLGMIEGHDKFARPSLKLLEAPTEAKTQYSLYADDIRVTSVKNGLAPVFKYYQDKATGLTVAVRFLATVDMLYYDEVGFMVKGTTGEEKDLHHNVVYSSVIAADKDVTAERLGGRYIAPFTVTDIPYKGTVTFEVIPYAVFMGERIKGEKSVIEYRK